MTGADRPAGRPMSGPAPGPATAAALSTLAMHEPAVLHTQLPVLWTAARGGRVFGEAGQAWLDWTSGVFAANLGHAPPTVVAAMREQLRAPLLHAYAFATQVRADTARLLCGLTGFRYTVLATTGAEAAEVALKLCRSRARSLGRRRAIVVSFDGAFHGRTAGAQLAGGLAHQRHWTPDADGEFARLPYPCDGRDPVADLTAAAVAPHEVACVLVEPFQGSTMRAIDTGSLAALAAWCRAHDVPLVLDEIQSGFGRTGPLFAYHRLGVKPDVLLLGKGMASGMPVSAVVYDNPDLVRALRTGELTSTHAANPVALAAARATLEAFAAPDVLANVPTVATTLERLVGTLAGTWPERIGFRAAYGAIAGVAVTDPDGRPDPRAARELVRRCAVEGLLLLAPVGADDNLVKFAPPPVSAPRAMVEGAHAVLAAAATALADPGDELRAGPP